jgi:phosphoglycolate phosphatase
MRIKLVICDLDGTLFTSDAIVYQAYQAAVAEFNQAGRIQLTTPSLPVILGQIGNPVRSIYKSLFPELDKEQAMALGHRIRKHLIDAIHLGQGRLLPEVAEILAALSDAGIELRVASNGHKDYVEAVIAHYGLKGLFGPTVYLNHADLQDKGDILNLYKSLLGIQTFEMVMVGDRKSDLDAAQKASCHFIGIAGGHGLKAELDFPGVRLIQRFDELPMALAQIVASNSNPFNV